MKRVLHITTLLVATITFSACDSLNSLISTPPADYTGTYADMDVDFGAVCGVPRKGEVHLRISTETGEDASVHDLTLTSVIFDAGADGETITHEATWRVNGRLKNLNSGAIADFGTVTLARDGSNFSGHVTIYNVECATPATDPSKPDLITYTRVTVPFKATAQ